MSEPVSLFQFSDLHLFSDDKKTLLGHDTNDSFLQVQKMALASDFKADFSLLTGDLIQDYLPSTYDKLLNMLEVHTAPIYWLPGNHDTEVAYTQLSSSNILHPDKIIDQQNWRIILLNSVVWGEVGGLLNQAELSNLEQALASQTSDNTLICLHHPPLSIGCRWLDAICLKNQKDFWNIISHYATVKGIISGHVHQALSLSYQSVQVYTTPSTCIQFLPNSEEFALDLSVTPGYRTLKLFEDGTIETDVHRLLSFTYNISKNARGY